MENDKINLTEDKYYVPEELHHPMLKATIELQDIEVQRYNIIADMQFIISELKQEDYKERIKPIRTNIKDVLDRYIKLLKLLDSEKKNKEFLDAIHIEQIKQVSVSEIGETK